MDKRTRQQHQHNRDVFCSIGSIRQLAELLRLEKRRLLLLAQNPRYKTFEVPKKNGGQRLIEDPHPSLKKILSQLNRYLQSAYYLEKSGAVYGFIIGVRNDYDRRNVLTNARRHCNRSYLLNIDLKNFFHSVSRDMVLEILLQKPFRFRGELADILADLLTFNGRLAMGAPTSPALSNFACRQLDEQLMNFAKDMLWVYTRYADDMSFSATRPITSEMIRSVGDLITEAGFIVNPRKTKRYGPGEEKVVTGLLVSDKVSLPADYLPLLQTDIQRLSDALRVQNEQGELQTRWIDKFKQQVRGRLAFVGFVLRRDNKTYLTLKEEYILAIHPPEEEFGQVNWRSFPYNF